MQNILGYMRQTRTEKNILPLIITHFIMPRKKTYSNSLITNNVSLLVLLSCKTLNHGAWTLYSVLYYLILEVFNGNKM